MAVDRDRTHLHPFFRVKLVDLDAEIAKRGLPLELYEGGRSPFRQAELFSLGRVIGLGTYGKHSTDAESWGSFHQYGMAADYVVRLPGGGWHWPDKGDRIWREYQDAAIQIGLRVLPFEKPHVELPVRLSDLQAGRFPVAGDDTWEAWLEGNIEQWGQSARVINGLTMPGAPKLLSLLARPPLVG